MYFFLVDEAIPAFDEDVAVFDLGFTFQNRPSVEVLPVEDGDEAVLPSFARVGGGLFLLVLRVGEEGEAEGGGAQGCGGQEFHGRGNLSIGSGSGCLKWFC